MPGVKKKRFYEIPLPNELPPDQEGLVKYYNNSQKLMEYLEAKWAKNRPYYSALETLVNLKEYLLQKEGSYSYEDAMSWYRTIDNPRSGIHITIERLNDVYEYGTVQPVNAFPRSLPYCRLLDEKWSSLLDEYIRGMDDSVTVRMTIKPRTARFLYRTQESGINDPAEISYEFLANYYEADQHSSHQADAVYTYLIGRFLMFLADKGMCTHGLGLYMTYKMDGRLAPMLNFADKQSESIRCLKEMSGKSSENIFEDIRGFLIELETVGYGKDEILTAKDTLQRLVLFMDMCGLSYTSELSELWISYEKQAPYSKAWRSKRRAILFFKRYLDGEPLNPEMRFCFTPLACDSLPSWCRTQIDEFILLKEKEGYEKTTIGMYRAACTRFCRHLVAVGIEDFSEITTETIKDFNLSDVHSTAGSKNAYNVRIRKFLSFLERKEVLPYGMNLALMTTAATKETLVVTLSDQDKDDIRKKTERAETPLSLRDNAIILLGLQMGLRAVDITRLRLADVNWSEQSITIMQKKTQHEIRLPMPTEVGNAIYLYIKNGRPKTDVPEIFLNTKFPYGSLTADVCNETLGRMLPERNVQGSGFHVTRKTFATDRLRDNVKKEYIVDLLGHRTESTLDPYLSTDDERMRLCPLSLSETGLVLKGGAYDVD